MDAATVANRLENLDCNSTWLSLTRYDDLKISPLSTRVSKWNEDTLITQTSVPTFEVRNKNKLSIIISILLFTNCELHFSWKHL